MALGCTLLVSTSSLGMSAFIASVSTSAHTRRVPTECRCTKCASHEHVVFTCTHVVHTLRLLFIDIECLADVEGDALESAQVRAAKQSSRSPHLVRRIVPRPCWFRAGFAPAIRANPTKGRKPQRLSETA